MKTKEAISTEALVELAKQAVEKGEGLVVPLERPIKLKDDSVLAELSFRAMRGREWRAMPADLSTVGYDKLLDTASALSGQPPAIMDLLHTADVHRVGAVVMVFLVGGRPTGSPQSE